MHGFCGVLLLFFLKMRYLIPGVIMILVDILYLSTFGKNIFVPMISSIQKEKVQFRWYAAILCYILLVFGLDYFIISQKRPLIDAFILGVCIYGVYETVNLATFKKWKPMPALIDTVWGGTLMALTTYLTYKVKSLKH
tara:strand:- start:224 stop:637 length:414 start_codon:yes stop_codon:yes gene_type:complete